MNMERRQEEHPEQVPEEGDRRRRSHAQRKMRYALLGLAVVAAVAVGFWALGSVITQNRQDIDATNRAARIACAEANKVRDGERALWQHQEQGK